MFVYQLNYCFHITINLVLRAKKKKRVEEED